MKIIGRDNQARDEISDCLWLDEIPDIPEMLTLADRIVERLNKGLGDGPGMHFCVVSNDYKLFQFKFDY